MALRLNVRARMHREELLLLDIARQRFASMIQSRPVTL